MQNKLKNIISDPLEEVGLDTIFARLKVNHHSSTSLGMPDGIFSFRYIWCTQEIRRLFDGNANMASGVAVNNALQYYYADKIWKLNPLTKKIQPQENKRLDAAAAIDKAMEEFRRYKPVNDVDQEKFDHYIETIPQTIRQGIKCLNEFQSKFTACEEVINHTDKRLGIPIVGRSDFSFYKGFDKEQSLSGERHGSKMSSQDNLLSVLVELKTSWQKPMKKRKDGSRSFSSARLPSTPAKAHLQQLAFYATAAKPREAILLYVTADGYKIFSKENCADLEPENLKNYYELLVKAAIRRERLLKRYSHLNDIEKIKLLIIADTDPMFEHPYYWKIGHQFVKEAQDLWNNL